MKLSTVFWPLAVVLLVAPCTVFAQAGNTGALLNAYTELNNDVYRLANTPEALARMRKDLVKAPEAYLVSIPQPAVLIFSPTKRIKVANARYNVALRLLEATDSTGSHVWPAGSLYGFELGPRGDVRSFRTHLVKTGSTRLEFVEKISEAETPPLLLALQHNYVHEDAVYDPILHTEKVSARTVIGQVVLTGPGTDPKTPLRELVMNQRNVLKLFGDKEAQVKAYAVKENLSYTDLGGVMRMVEYYNKTLMK